VGRRSLAFITVGLFAISLAACGGGGGGSTLPSGGGTPAPTPTPTVTPTSTPTVAPQSATCPTSGSLPTSFGSGSTSEGLSVARRAPQRGSIQRYVPGTLAVTYSGATPVNRIDRIAGNMRGKVASDLQMSDGVRTRIISIDPSQTNEAIAQLRSLSGVRSVAQVAYRQRMAITINDPYYVGFGPSAPYYEDSATAGQWDMHVMNLEGAWNQMTAPVTGAKIAIIDTGVDVTHPELAGGKIVRTKCFVTYPSGTAQTTGSYVTDTDGHGTNVAGIADGDTNNNLGFVGVAFGAQLMAYRIFPSDPTGGCENSTSPQCSANTADEASAINDAVANGAKVINLSLGSSGPCSSSDPEYQAIENAINFHSVVVIAAAGNESASSLDCPAADPGVIAVGATGLHDSTPPITEGVASYSNSGTKSGYYVVAPGGDPTPADTDPNATTTDFLHWIEHIYSSTATPPMSCTVDKNALPTAPKDCRVLIAGTSQATPHVVGVASLILAVRPSYTPAQVAAAICNSADNINDAKQGCGRVNAAAAVSYALANP
jgi:subtilisin family serine protease